MAEVQTSTHSGELTQRFIEFVMMQAQQASLFLGRIPHPQSGKAEVLLEPAKLFIDQLEMIREKTRGNLTNQETEILNSVLSDLEMAYVQASKASITSPAPSPPATGEELGKSEETSAEASSEGSESKKKFSKSYGA
jgi:Domain of unknown function (DUF1844)